MYEFCNYSHTCAPALGVIFVLFALAGAPNGVIADEFGAGVTAYKSGRFSVANEIFSQLTLTHDARVQFALWLMYDGEGVNADQTLARQWYAKSAAQGYAKGQYNLALLCEREDSIENNKALARKCFIRAAEAGNTGGVAWLRNAAELRDAHAQFHPGRTYLLARGIP
jgi:hypothetical protein